MRPQPARLIATWFGVGLAPLAPGTAASLAALPIAWGLMTVSGALGLALATALLFGLGVWAAGATSAALGDGDPQTVVVDEVAGQWLAILPAAALSSPVLWHYALAFVLFRAADIGKPWPAGWIDRNLGGGMGIMLDDVAAGLYAALGLGLAIWVSDAAP